ncbi:LLM class flavin-dependent oxidoreductase [Nonomuraea sp. PA05]|uniref:LLM class flavin-dependent oxidoreductase n=1 Tax=Nonomuraea sp. PA05 TaxID=2604466 RepID=UPI0011D6B2DB|nr:LLM class flavin-dependent oxidoreductase [Nonomuraea sp. PA05]TYB60572.1 LLM class flavin-dependent oxidoreductase [Nonomuraea sp. PA05]
MEVGVGLPTTVHGTDGATVLEWARRADAHGFSSLGVLDRLVAGNHEPVVTLAAAAAVTRRIRLATTILIAAYRGGGALLAKQLATVDRLSGGRLAVGVAAGGRADDFEAMGQPYRQRGRRLDALIGELRETWTPSSRIGPRPVTAGGPPIWVGGHTDAALRRAARLGQGWIAGGSSSVPYAQLAERARAAWTAEGRTARPRMVALAYFSFGSGAADRARAHMRRYYEQAGPYADRAAAQTMTTEDELRRTLEEYASAGCDELIFFPCSSDPDQVDLLAKAALT